MFEFIDIMLVFDVVITVELICKPDEVIGIIVGTKINHHDKTRNKKFIKHYFANLLEAGVIVVNGDGT